MRISHRVLLPGAALFFVTFSAMMPAAAQTSSGDNFGFVRFIHTAIDVSAIDIYTGDTSQTPAVSNLAYGQATEFMTLPSSVQGYVVRPAGSGPSGDVLFRLNRRVKPNQSEIIAAAGLASRRAFVLEPLIVIRSGTRGNARVRVFNMVWGGPYLTVKDNTGAVYGQDLQYLSSSGDIDVAPGTYSFEVQSGAGKAVGKVENLNLEADKVYSLMIIGGMEGDPPVHFVVLDSEQETTRVRIVNNGNVATDVYIKGNDQPFVKDIVAGATTDFMPVPSGATTFVLRAANSTPNSPELAFVAPQLRPGRDITITINGTGVATQMGITEDHLTQLTATPAKLQTPAATLVATPAG